MNQRKTLSLTLSAAMALSLVTPALASNEKQPWYAEAQAYVMDKGIMVGTNLGFEPMGLVTRAQAIRTMYNMAGKPAAAKSDFTDTAGKWYADAADWAVETGLMEVPENKLFQGDTVITREELAIILSRGAEIKHLPAVQGGMAVKAAADYSTLAGEGKAAMEACFNNGLIKGKATNGSIYLDPAGQTSRAELATLLMRYDQLKPVYTEQTVAIEVAAQDGIPAHTIPGTLTMPTSASTTPCPAVVMLHGTGSNRDEAGGGYAIAAPIMAASGIATLRIDFMGSGDSTANYTDYCYTSANLDAHAAASYLTELEGINDSQLAVMGWSQGGTNALLAAAEYPETFNAVITWSGSLDLDDMFPDFNAAYNTARTSGGYEMTFDWRDPLMVGERWFKEVKNTDLTKTLAKIQAPVLAINGDKDDVVLPETAQVIEKNAPKGRAAYISGADHTYNVFTGDLTAIRAAIDTGIGFLQETFWGHLEAARADSVSKYGNVTTTLPVAMLNGAGYKPGDLLKVTVGEADVALPYVTGYSNVDTGKPLTKVNKHAPLMEVAINMGNFAKTHSVTADTPITFAMGVKEGYLEEYEIRNIDSLRTNDRADYASDEVFANFRPVVMGDLKEGVLYRSSSPVNPELGRNTYSDTLIKKAGVKTVVNLADSQEELNSYPDYANSYYATLNVIPLNMGVDFSAPEFAEKLKSGMEYIIANKGPYLVHCTEGKDRAGFVSTLLEALMGASVEEMTNDYMLSFENYYGVEKGSSRWQRIAESNVQANLMRITGVDSVTALEGKTQAGAETYLTETVGLTPDQVSALRTALGG